ncbi:MAG: DUF6493 family protein [Vulcanimicrobiota bacterium]
MEEALRAGPEAVAEFFAGMAEPQRRAHGPRLLALYKALQQAPYQQPVEGFAYNLLHQSLPLALLACATQSELLSLRIWLQPDEVTLRIIQDREPAWLEQWAYQLLQKNPAHFALVWSLCQKGLIGLTVSESFLLGLINAPRRKSVLSFLQEEPRLLALVDRLFEVEGQGEVSLAAFDKYTLEQDGWSYALVQLSRSGALSRSHLLRLSLQALGRDFETFRAGWHSRFHESLEPQLEERVQLVEDYLPLLGSRVRPTVSFALKALQQIDRAGQLPLLAFLDQLPSVLASPDKGTAALGLKILLRNSDRVEHEQLLNCLDEGLCHTHPDIQSAALEALARLEPRPDRARWSARESILAASLVPRWRAWLKCPDSKVAVAEAVPLDLPVERPVLPCTGMDQLVQLTARLLEGPDSGLSVEIWLDGLVRWGRPEPRLAAPLLKRARHLVDKHRRLHYPAAPALKVSLAWLVLGWLQPEQPNPPLPGRRQDFLQRRLDEVAEILKGETLPGLLALPERPGGWILADRSQATGWPLDRQAARWRRPGPASEAPGYLVEVTQYEQYTFRRLIVQWPDLELPFEPQKPPEDIAWRRWQSIAWPAGRELWATQGLEQIANNLDWSEADWADRAYLENLLLDQPLGPRACLLLAFGLACKQAEQLTLAVDACLLALGRGHLDGRQIGQALAEAVATDMIKPSRWAKTLAQVAQEQPHHVWRALHSVAQLGELLPLLWELCHQLAKAPEPDVCARLSAWVGGGKQARLARQLAQMQSEFKG